MHFDLFFGLDDSGYWVINGMQGLFRFHVTLPFSCLARNLGRVHSTVMFCLVLMIDFLDLVRLRNAIGFRKRHGQALQFGASN